MTEESRAGKLKEKKKETKEQESLEKLTWFTLSFLFLPSWPAGVIRSGKTAP